MPIGFVQIIDPAEEESHYWGDVPANLRAIDIWIGEEAYLGKGHGTEIMRLAIDRCFAPPEVTAIIIDPLVSNTRSHRFYQRLGFAPIERRSFGAGRLPGAPPGPGGVDVAGHGAPAADRLLDQEGRRAADGADRRGPAGQRVDAAGVADAEPDSGGRGADSRRGGDDAAARSRDAATVDETLNGLVDQGLVRRLSAGLLELTADGAKLHRQALESQKTVRHRAVEGIDGADYATTVRVLQRLVRNLEWTHSGGFGSPRGFMPLVRDQRWIQLKPLRPT